MSVELKIQSSGTNNFRNLLRKSGFRKDDVEDILVTNIKPNSTQPEKFNTEVEVGIKTEIANDYTGPATRVSGDRTFFKLYYTRLDPLKDLPEFSDDAPKLITTDTAGFSSWEVTNRVVSRNGDRGSSVKEASGTPFSEVSSSESGYTDFSANMVAYLQSRKLFSSELEKDFLVSVTDDTSGSEQNIDSLFSFKPVFEKLATEVYNKVAPSVDDDLSKVCIRTFNVGTDTSYYITNKQVYAKAKYVFDSFSDIGFISLNLISPKALSLAKGEDASSVEEDEPQSPGVFTNQTSNKEEVTGFLTAQDTGFPVNTNILKFKYQSSSYNYNFNSDLNKQTHDSTIFSKLVNTTRFAKKMFLVKADDLAKQEEQPAALKQQIGLGFAQRLFSLLIEGTSLDLVLNDEQKELLKAKFLESIDQDEPIKIIKEADDSRKFKVFDGSSVFSQ